MLFLDVRKVPTPPASDVATSDPMADEVVVAAVRLPYGPGAAARHIAGRANVADTLFRRLFETSVRNEAELKTASTSLASVRRRHAALKSARPTLHTS